MQDGILPDLIMITLLVASVLGTVGLVQLCRRI